MGKLETLRTAYAAAKANKGAPGIDGVTFEAIEASGVAVFLQQLRDELVSRTYRPLRCRKQAIPKADGRKVRILSIPAIRDRVVQGALKCVLEPIFEADFQPGSFGYRPQKSAHQAVDRVTAAIRQNKTRVIDLDLRAYFDHVRHDLLLAKVARRVNDRDVLALLKQMLKASGKMGVPQGGVVSPLLSNLYLTEVDRMLERAKEATRFNQYTAVEYARFADDLVILLDAHPRHAWLLDAVHKRLREELARLHVEVNEEKSRLVDLAKGETVDFLGFTIRRVRSRRGVWWPQQTPQLKKRTALLRKLKEVFRSSQSQPVARVIDQIMWNHESSFFCMHGAMSERGSEPCPSSRGVGPAGVGVSANRLSNRSTASAPSSTAARSSSVSGMVVSIRWRCSLASRSCAVLEAFGR